jgi:hypothetical protein
MYVYPIKDIFLLIMVISQYTMYVYPIKDIFL